MENYPLQEPRITQEDQDNFIIKKFTNITLTFNTKTFSYRNRNLFLFKRNSKQLLIQNYSKQHKTIRSKIKNIPIQNEKK